MLVDILQSVCFVCALFQDNALDDILQILRQTLIQSCYFDPVTFSTKRHI